MYGILSPRAMAATVVALLISTSTFSQEKLSPEEYEKMAKDIKAQLEGREDINTAITYATSVYSFDIIKPDQENKAYASEVSASEESVTEYMALKKGATVKEHIFYDSQSIIKESRVLSGKGKILPYFPTDRNYNSGDIFHNDAKYRTYVFGIDELAERKRLEYTKQYYDVKYLVSVYFHSENYTKNKKITFEIPDWLDIELKDYNFEGYNINKQVNKDAKRKMTIVTYEMNDIVPVHRDSYSPAFAKNYPHILVLARKYTNKGTEKNIFATADDLYAWYHLLTASIDNKPDVLKDQVTKLTAGKKTDMEKIESVFYWVQDNIRYIAFENGIMGFKPESASNVYQNRYGDCKGMANLLKEMLKICGYDARLTWIGTNDIPYDYKTPSLGVDNHMICTVVLDGKKMFLDGTESYIAINDYAHRIQGREVMIENGNTYNLDRVPEFDKMRNKVETNISMDIVNDQVVGKSSGVYNGEFKTYLLRHYSLSKSEKKEENIKEFISGGNSNLAIKTFNMSDPGNRQSPLTIDFDFAFNNAITRANNEVYLAIDFEKMYGNYEIDTLRTDDFELESKRYFVSTTTLKVPAGYKVDYMPEKFEIKHPDYNLLLTYEQAGDKIIYKRELSIDNALIKKKDVKKWNDTIKKLKKHYNDQIVFIKQ